MSKPRVTDNRTLGVHTLNAYLGRNGRTFSHYAYLMTGSRADANAIMRGFSAELGRHWGYALRQAAYDAYAWRLLRAHVDRWLEEHGREPRVAETAARRRAETAGQLGRLQHHLATSESDLGLYQALGRLSERQCDVMVLRFLLNKEVEDIAGYMGVGIGTVYSTINQARDALMRSSAVRSLIRPMYRPVSSADPLTPNAADSGNE